MGGHGRMRALFALALAIAAVAGGGAAAAGDPPWATWEDVELARPKAFPAVAARIADDRMADARAEYARETEAAARTARERIDALDRRLKEAMAAAGVGYGTGSASGGGAAGGGLSGGIGSPAAGGAVDLQALLLGGLAHFVERRAREEAIQWTLGVLRARLCGDHHPIRSLFRSTCGLLAGLVRAGEALSPLPMLRESVQRDLHDLPPRLFDAARALGSQGAPLRCGLGLARAFDRLIGAGHAASALVSGVAVVVTVEDCGRALIFSTRTQADARSRATRDALELVAGAVDIADDTTTLEGSVLGALDDEAAETKLPEAVSDLADGVSQGAEALESAATAMLDDKGEKPSALGKVALEVKAELAAVVKAYNDAHEAHMRTYARASMVATEPVRAAVARVAGPAASLSIALRDLRAGGRDAAARVAAYQAAVHAAAATAREAFAVASDAGEAVVDPMFVLVDAAQEMRAGNHAGGFAGMVASGLLPLDQEPFRTLVQSSELLIGIAGAGSSEEMGAVIEAAAPRPGGWQRKRARVTLGLGAQLGMAAGVEWLRGDELGNRATTLQVSAPAGFDIAAPLGPHSLGLLLQVIDLGTLTSIRFAGADSAERQARAELTSVFAPGALIYLGLGRSPFVLSAGASYVSGLRETDEGAHADAVRVQAALAVDVPLFLF